MVYRTGVSDAEKSRISAIEVDMIKAAVKGMADPEYRFLSLFRKFRIF